MQAKTITHNFVFGDGHHTSIRTISHLHQHTCKNNGCTTHNHLIIHHTYSYIVFSQSFSIYHICDAYTTCICKHLHIEKELHTCTYHMSSSGGCHNMQMCNHLVTTKSGRTAQNQRSKRNKHTCRAHVQRGYIRRIIK